MGPSNHGMAIRLRRRVALAVIPVLLVALIPATSPAAEFSLSSRTYLLYFKQDITGGEEKTYAPAFEYLSGDARNLGGVPLSFHFYGWGRLDLAEDTGSGNRTGDIGSAYVQYLHPTGNAEIRLGRFFLTEGVAMETIDGGFVKMRTPLGIGISGFGGAPVEMSIVSPSIAEKGDAIYGGRVFYVYPGIIEIGGSYLEETGTFADNNRKEFGGDLWLRPVAPVELIGRATYNDTTRGMAFQRYMARITPVARVSLSGGYEAYAYLDYFQTALNPVFLSPNVDNTDEVRIIFGVLDLEVVKNLVLTGGYRHIRHDRIDPGTYNRAEGGLRYSYNEHKDAAGVSGAVVTGDLPENEYQEYRVYITYSPGRFRFTADGLTHRYKEQINGKKNEYQAVASAGVRIASTLKVSGDFRYTQSPTFKEDYAGLLRISLDLATGSGGSK